MNQVDQLPSYPQIVDGFCYSGLFGARPNNGLSWYWRCLANMEDLRLASDSYRPRWWIVPKNFLGPSGAANLLAGHTEFYDFQVKPGSWLWGLQFAVSNDALSQSVFSVIIRQGQDLPLFDRVMTASGIYSGSPVDPFNTLMPSVGLLEKPRLVVSPSQIHCEVSNDSDPANAEDNISCQLLLLFAEPK